MGMTLIVIGIGWALLGVLNLITGVSKLHSAGYSDAWLGFAVIFNMFAFVLPGLGLAGIGALVRRRTRGSRHGKAAMQSTSDVKQCPFCAETIKREATICRYCQRELPVNVPLGSDQLMAITARPPTKDARHISDNALTAILLAGGLLGAMVVWWGVMLWAPVGSDVQDTAIGLYVITHKGLTAVGIPTPDPQVVIRYFHETQLPSTPPSIPRGQITMAMYDTISTGMPQPVVVLLLGTAGRELSRTELAGTTTIMYVWQNRDGSNMNVMFQDGRVVGKAQFGLK